MKKFFSLFAAVLFAGSMMADTYSLEKVSAVEAGKSYVIVRNNKALVAEVKSDKLQTTAEFLTEGLTGEENYVWTLEDATGGFYLKSGSQYLNNASKANMNLGTKGSSKWSIAFTDGVALISNNSNNGRFIGETSTNSGEYKAYATSNIGSYGHDFTVYGLKQEDPTKPSIAANKIDFGSVQINYDEESYVLDTTLVVTAKNLTENIAVTEGANVKVTEKTVAKEGGNLTLKVTAVPGEFQDTIVLTSGELSLKVAVVGVVSQKKAPGAAGEFTLYEGELVEGDYLIVSDGAAMDASISSDRLGYKAVTIENDAISNEEASIVWHIAKSGDYWTIYNASEEVYAASTGAKNKADLASEVSDKALWTASMEDGKFEFVNKQNTANSVNANLRKNGNYGFACYGTSTGSALLLYKGTPVVPTAIENTAVEAKAFKTFENGQLVIIKNGVKYDVTGAVIR